MSEVEYDKAVVTQTPITRGQPTPSEWERRCAQHLMTILPQFRRVIDRDQAGLEFPLTMQQYAVLKVLSDGNCLISELADRLRVSRPTMTRIVDGLEGRRRTAGESGSDERERRPKLVERVESHEDRRLVYAHITAEGTRILNCYHSKAEESALSLLRKVPSEEMPMLEHVFDILQNALTGM